MKLKLTCLTVLLFLFLSASNIYSQNLQFDKLSLKKSSVVFKDSSNTLLTPKNSLLAGSLSFIVPGFALGQLYNGEKNKFFIHSLISTGFIFTYIMTGGKLTEFNLAGAESINLAGIALMIAYTINWTWSVVDAVKSANEINKQIKLQKYRSDFMNKIKFGLTFDKQKQLNINFNFEL